MKDSTLQKIEKYRKCFEDITEFYNKNSRMPTYSEQSPETYYTLTSAMRMINDNTKFYWKYLKDVVKDYPVILNNLDYRKKPVVLDERIQEFLDFYNKNDQFITAHKSKVLYEYLVTFRDKFKNNLSTYEEDYKKCLEYPEVIAFLFYKDGEIVLPTDKYSITQEFEEKTIACQERHLKTVKENRRKKILDTVSNRVTKKKKTKTPKKVLEVLTDEEIEELNIRERKRILREIINSKNEKRGRVPKVNDYVRKNLELMKDNLRETFARIMDVYENIYRATPSQVKWAREILRAYHRKYKENDERMELYVNEVLEEYPTIQEIVHTCDLKELSRGSNRRLSTINHAKNNKLYKNLIEKYNMFDWQTFGSTHIRVSIPDLDIDQDILDSIFKCMEEGLDDETIDDVLFLQGPEVVSVIRELMKIENNPFCIAYWKYLESKEV